MPLVTSQPFAVNAPIAAVFAQSNEKGCAHEEYGRQYTYLNDAESRHCRCKSRRRRIVLSIALVFFIAMFLVGVVGLWDATCNDSSLLKGALGLTADGGENSWTVLGDLMKRQSDASSGSSSTFVSRKCACCRITISLPISADMCPPPRLLDHCLCGARPRGACWNLSQRLVLQRWGHRAISLQARSLLIGCVAAIGVFENPLCCPCYVCACCGGLGTSL